MTELGEFSRQAPSARAEAGGKGGRVAFKRWSLFGVRLCLPQTVPLLLTYVTQQTATTFWMLLGGPVLQVRGLLQALVAAAVVADHLFLFKLYFSKHNYGLISFETQRETSIKPCPLHKPGLGIPTSSTPCSGGRRSRSPMPWSSTLCCAVSEWYYYTVALRLPNKHCKRSIITAGVVADHLCCSLFLLSGGFIALTTPRSVSMSCLGLGGPSFCQTRNAEPQCQSVVGGLIWRWHLLVVYSCSLLFFVLTRRRLFAVPMEFTCVMLWRPEALDCRVLIPPGAWNWLTRKLPSLGFEPQTSCICEPALNQLSYRCNVLRGNSQSLAKSSPDSDAGLSAGAEDVRLRKWHLWRLLVLITRCRQSPY